MKGIDIHWHVYDVINLLLLIEKYNEMFTPWKRNELIKTMDFDGANEFYIKLVKWQDSEEICL